MGRDRGTGPDRRTGPPTGWRSVPLDAKVYFSAVVVLALTVTSSAWSGPLTSVMAIRAVAVLGLAIGYAEATTRIGWLGRLLGGGSAYSDHQSIWTYTAVLVLPFSWAATVLTMILIHTGWQRRRTGIAGQVHRVASTAATVLLAARAVVPLLGADPTVRLAGTTVDAVRVWTAGTVFSTVNLILLLPGIWLATGRPPIRSLLPRWSAVGAEATTLLLAVVTAILIVRAPAFTPTGLVLNAVLHRAALTGQLRHAADRDRKTGLLNAVAWHERAAALLGRGRRDDSPVTVLLIDLDHFKAVNDTHGHLAGDEVLAAVAETLRTSLRPGDVLGRFGGEEFVAALSGMDLPAGLALADRLREAIAAAPHPDIGPVTASIGLAHRPRSAIEVSIDQLLGAADGALYAAKHAGRNQVHTATVGLPASLLVASAAHGEVEPDVARPAA